MAIVECGLRPQFPVSPPTTFDTDNPVVRLLNWLHLDDSVRLRREYDYAEHRFYDNWQRLLLPLTEDWVHAAVVRTEYYPGEITIFWRWWADGQEWGARFPLNNHVFAHNPEPIIALFHCAVDSWRQESLMGHEETL